MSGAGIDFGTSNSVAAIRVSGTSRLVPLEGDAAVLPSATYIDRERQTLTGQAAIDRYVEENSGRRVELVPEEIGHSAMLVDAGGADSRAPPETARHKVYGQPMDPGLPGRLFRGLKRLLGDPGTRRLMVFDQPFRLVALITPQLLRMRHALERALAEHGERLQNVPLSVGHPITFEGRDPHRNALALDRLREACGYAGFPALAFYPEPVAATLSWLEGTRGGEGCALTVDFGGGTLDLSLIRFAPEAFEVLATDGAPVGGDHIDQRLFRELLFPLLGKGVHWRRQGDKRVIDTPFPFERYEDALLNWAMTYTLNQNRFRAPIVDRIRQGGEDAEKLERLYTLITGNHGYLAFRALRRAKIALSSAEEARVDIPELDVDVSLTRARFEAICAEIFAQVASRVDRLIARAGLRHADVDVVVRTGGSSLIPAVVRRLDERFPGRIVEHDPFTSVANGLALAAERELGFEPERGVGEGIRVGCRDGA